MLADPEAKLWGAHGRPDGLVRRLSHLVRLSDDDHDALVQVTSRERVVGPNTELFAQGEVADWAVVVLDGFACRYAQRRNGRRQIVSYLLPGDMCDPDVVFLTPMHEAVGTLTTCRIAQVDREALVDVIAQHPRLARAFRLSKVVEEAIMREWLVSLGCRSAIERMAHFFCEILVRLQVVGFANQDSCDLPLTQAVLADTLGLSAVHVNRTLQVLRQKGLVDLSGKRLRVTNLAGLRGLCEFSADYLYPGATGPDAPAAVAYRQALHRGEVAALRP